MEMDMDIEEQFKFLYYLRKLLSWYIDFVDIGRL